MPKKPYKMSKVNKILSKIKQRLTKLEFTIHKAMINNKCI